MDHIADKQLMLDYLANLKAYISPRLIEGIFIQNTIYPYYDGAIICSQLTEDLNCNDRIKENSSDFKNVITSIGIHLPPDILRDQKFPNGTQINSTANNFYIFKNNDITEWHVDKISDDSKVIDIILNAGQIEKVTRFFKRTCE